jgi:hypothetical protein
MKDFFIDVRASWREAWRVVPRQYMKLFLMPFRIFRKILTT